VTQTKSSPNDKHRTPERRALGKGLDSLLPRVAPQSVPAIAAEEEASGSIEVPLTQIDRNPFQTRTYFDEKLLDELARSITANGVLQPILVRPIPQGRYQLIAGERRWKAAKLAGLRTIPALVRPVADEQALEITIVENLQRADLNPIEQAKAYERLSREFGMTQEQMAVRTGKERASVGNFLRLLRLPESVQEKVANGTLSFGHARTLVALDSHAQMESVANKIISLSLSVRQSETYVQGLIHPERTAVKTLKLQPILDPNVVDAQQRLQQALGLKVTIEDRQGRGVVHIEYSGLGDFDILMDRLLAPVTPAR
jgi:ParB family chromosome partitioning protein